MKFRHAALAAFIVAGPLSAHASCGSAFCSVNTSFDVQGAWTEPGARFDLRYEQIRQDQPRSGSAKVSVGQIPRHHDEVNTLNRNWLANLDYAIDSKWGVAVTAPLVDREHLHIHNHGGGKLPESWNFSEFGDVRVLGRYRMLSSDSSEFVQGAGFNFGFKLPTGRIDVRNPAGDAAERSLQPGTGTTDAVVGAYYNRALPLADVAFFAQGLFQSPLNARAGYRPGQRLALDAGVRYNPSETVGVMLQLNALFRARDSGVQAEPLDSGGRAWFLSPGVSYAATKDVQVYGFLQLPLYQYVNGVQLTAGKAVVAGLSAKF